MLSNIVSFLYTNYEIPILARVNALISFFPSILIQIRIIGQIFGVGRDF